VKDLYEQLTEKLVAKPVAAVMYQGDVLSMKELESIQNCNSCDAASKLLNCLLQQPVVGMVECFMEALKSTNQHHIFLWISFSGIKQCKIVAQGFVF
jgi:hypothetical protein